MLTASFPCMILHRRNLTCIGCGCPRSNAAMPSGPQQQQQQQQQPTRNVSSPRFASYPAHSDSLPNSSSQLSVPQQQPIYSSCTQLPKSSLQSLRHNQPQQSVYPSSAPAPILKSVHPLLTPSGRAFAVGGKVQNVSGDPLNPCIMYWPDNEPFPEQGQIRPSNLVGVPVRTIVSDICLMFMYHLFSSNLPSSTPATEDL